MTGEWLGLANLRNLSGFAAAGLADDDGSGASLDGVENGGAVPEHRQPLPLPLQIRIAASVNLRL